MPKLTFSERATFTLVSRLSIKRKYADHLSELPYENKCSVSPGKFWNALVKILFLFDKSMMPKLTFGERATFTLVSCLSIKRKYADHLSELPYENKCSVSPGKFWNALVKILFLFDKSMMPKLTFGERATFTLVSCLSIKQEI